MARKGVFFTGPAVMRLEKFLRKYVMKIRWEIIFTVIEPRI
jgi:hypothetical protein